MESSIEKAPEIGSLWADDRGGSRFVGSASGVYFLRTVQNAFSQAATRLHSMRQTSGFPDDQTSPSQLSPECFFGNEEDPNSSHPVPERSSVNQNTWSFLNGVRRFPSHEQTKALTKIYFQKWHPLFPFLHGPTFLKSMEEALVGAGEVQRSGNPNLSRDIILHCIWNIAILDAPELKPMKGLHRCAPEDLLPALSILALNDNLISIQALLSAQLYFVATMSLHSALVIGGLTIRAIIKSGLHRCPFRYPEISPLNCEMRKRVFWCAYVLDRFLSQALGQPLGIHDSDIDVCLPGPQDLHDPALSTTNLVSENFPMNATVHLPRTHPDHQSSSPINHADVEGGRLPELNQNTTTQIPGTNSGPESRNQPKTPTQLQGQSALSDFVISSQLMGRTLQTFHVSIHVRSVSLQDIWSLRADIESWANNSNFQEAELEMSFGLTSNTTDGVTANLALTTFSVVSYYQLHLIMNRPRLSLKQKTVEFKMALQVCVNAAKSILQTLRIFVKGGNRIFWPGHLLAVWMSGLVIAFACRLKAYDMNKAMVNLNQAIELLQGMSHRWLRAKACLSVLKELLENIKSGGEVLDHRIGPQTAGKVANSASKRKRSPTNRHLTSTPQDHTVRNSRNSRDPSVSRGSYQPRFLNVEEQSNPHGTQNALHTGSDPNSSSNNPLHDHSTFPFGGTSGYEMGAFQRENISIPPTWSEPPQNGLFSLTGGEDAYLNTSNYAIHDTWSHNTDLDFTVWDALQSLVTNADVGT